jgi:oligopeptide/dipeptide ABC transporter ATP-binding protein
MAPFAKWLPSNRRCRREARRRAIDALRTVGIPDPERRIFSYPHEFSGGMKQRVLIATAIVGCPELLIADEPTTALDVSIQAQILRLIQELVRELDLTVLLITHNLGVVAKVCNKAAVMYAGRVVEQGPLRSIFKESRHPYTLGLLRAVPTRGQGKGQLQVIPGSIPSLVNPPAGCCFHPRCPRAMPQCADDPPPVMRPVGRDHGMACHLYDA